VMTLDTFVLGQKTASADTAFTHLVPPWRGSGGAPLAYRVVGGRPNWHGSGAYTHIDSLVYTSAGTAHTVTVMRPLNWAIVNGDVAANATAVTLHTDPGAYSTSGSYKYPLPPDASSPSQVASNAIAANDYVAVQLRDGTWHLSTIASGSGTSPVLTTAIPNITGGGVEDGAIMFFFGITTDTVPQTGQAHVPLLTVASTRQELLASSRHGPSFRSLNPGDPILLYSNNATAAGSFSLVAGHYAKP